MRRLLLTFLLVACLITPVAAQPEADSPPDDVPNGAPAPTSHLGALDRWRNYRRDAIASPSPYLATLLPALAEQGRQEPVEFGTGLNGFGNRLGRRVAQYQLQTALYHSTAALLGTRTGYRPCGCSGGARRLGYALSRTFVTTTDAGRTVPNLAYLGGVFGGATIAAQAWYPERYRAASRRLRGGTIQIGVTTARHVLQEFGPELKRVFRRP